MAHILTETEARDFAREWVRAWNSHDLEEILSHYAADVVLTSPIAAKLRNDPSGTVVGKAALHNYFEHALAAFPDLRFELIDVMWGLGSLVLYYVNQTGTKVGEFMEWNADGKVIRVVANYGGA